MTLRFELFRTIWLATWTWTQKIREAAEPLCLLNCDSLLDQPHQRQTSWSDSTYSEQSATNNQKNEAIGTGFADDFLGYPSPNEHSVQKSRYRLSRKHYTKQKPSARLTKLKFQCSMKERFWICNPSQTNFGKFSPNRSEKTFSFKTIKTLQILWAMSWSIELLKRFTTLHCNKYISK